MAKRGRKSSTSVAVLPPVDPAEIESIARPEPPECLDVSARDVWLGVVDNLSADWFEPVMFPVLEQYCRHVVEARRLNALIVQAVEKHSFYSPMRLRQELSGYATWRSRRFTGSVATLTAKYWTDRRRTSARAASSKTR